MDNSEKEIEVKKLALKNWLKDKYNLALVGILILAFAFRVYYFFLAKEQAHWWDSLAYGSLAKEMIYNLWSDNAFIIHESIIRPPLLPLLWSILLRLGFNDSLILFILEIIPSTLSIFFLYLIGKEFYSKRVGIFVAFLGAISWIHLFYSVRIMTDVPSLFLAIVSIYYFSKCKNSISIKNFFLSIFFLSLSVLMRYSYGLIGFVYLVFFIFVYRNKLFINKSFWIGGILGIVPIILFFIINLSKFGSIMPALDVYSGDAQIKPFAFYVLEFIPYIIQKTFTIFLFFGISIALFDLILGFGSINKIEKLKAHLFNILLISFSLFFFIFIIKAAEDRYLMILFPSIFLLSSISVLFFYDFIKKYSYFLASTVLIILLMFFLYSQINFSQKIISEKKESFIQMKEAFLWIKDNTEKKDIILGDWADPYAIYYSERKLGKFPKNLSELEEFSLKNIDYLTLTAVHQPTKEVVQYTEQQSQKGNLIPVKIIYFDREQKNPAVIIYKVKK